MTFSYHFKEGSRRVWHQMKPESSVGLLFHNKSPNYVCNCHLKVGDLRKAPITSHRLFQPILFLCGLLLLHACFFKRDFNVFSGQACWGLKGFLIRLQFRFKAAISYQKIKSSDGLMCLFLCWIGVLAAMKSPTDDVT